MILQLPLQLSTIDPVNDHVLIIGGLDNLLHIAKVPDEDNLLRRFALNEDISHLRRHAANTIVVTWLETIDLTVYPPKLQSQPLQYVNSLHNARRFFHGSTVILETEITPDCFDPDTIPASSSSTYYNSLPSARPPSPKAIYNLNTEHRHIVPSDVLKPPPIHQHHTPNGIIPYQTRHGFYRPADASHFTTLTVNVLGLDSPLSVASTPRTSLSSSTILPNTPTGTTLPNSRPTRPSSAPPIPPPILPLTYRPRSASLGSSPSTPLNLQIPHPTFPPVMTSTKVPPFSGAMNENGYEWLKDIESFFMEAQWNDNTRRCEYFRLRLRGDADRRFNSFDDATQQTRDYFRNDRTQPI
ncbi:hypothetical protein M422DRAFT_269556 [Sphaerobolus stellatus SS14]|uniref:Unplaced genomic scaffold SPHSTscaffold_215, whole genome shotgun sequence n=1 Tax=Sphaerobolus stellatus (strain SS14) TaxID=990650 RepID=A0A0C9UJQ3_SPHS4|nr:hypothetical protein M422DRAFT_269556 [Sphaerobolus stellatus SS14]